MTVNFFLQTGHGATFTKRPPPGSDSPRRRRCAFLKARTSTPWARMADLVCRAQERQPRQLHRQPLHQLLQLLHLELPVLRLCPQETRRRRHGNSTVEEIVEKAREALAVGRDGTAHCRRPASLAAVQLLHRHAAGAEGGGRAPAIEMLHRHRNSAPGLAGQKIGAPDVCVELQEAGLDSLTGGGAEIFRQEVRSRHRPRQGIGGGISGRSPRLAPHGRAEHLHDALRPRGVAGRPRGSSCAICAACRTKRAASPVSCRCPTSRTTTTFRSTCRRPALIPCAPSPSAGIYLDNFDHITAYWVGLGLKLAQVALSYGADDLHGTILEEHIFHMAGATTPQLQTEAEMIKAIRETGPHAGAARHLLPPDQSLGRPGPGGPAGSRCFADFAEQSGIRLNSHVNG